MDGAPAASSSAAFDSARVRWVDLEGTGTSGMLSVSDGEAWYYPNYGGRRFGTGQRVRGLLASETRPGSNLGRCRRASGEGAGLDRGGRKGSRGGTSCA